MPNRYSSAHLTCKSKIPSLYFFLCSNTEMRLKCGFIGLALCPDSQSRAVPSFLYSPRKPKNSKEVASFGFGNDTVLFFLIVFVLLR